MRAVILAGGLGTRISEGTYLKPKPMIEIGGRPIFWHILKIYSYYGIDEFIICLGYKGYTIWGLLMSVPKVSAYICTFNRAELLRESIRSVLDQTYGDLAVVVLDNASTDHTREVVSSFDDPRLSYVRHEENLGAFRNCNYGLDHANTEYVCIFHDDDRMLPWMIAEEVKIMELQSELGLVASSKLYVLGSGEGANDPLKRES